MSYDLDTPLRAFHLANLGNDYGVRLRDPDEVYLIPDPRYSLPDDRGALVALGTTRLPLSRRACGQTLWRFFDGLGPVGVDKRDANLRWKQKLLEYRGKKESLLAKLLHHIHNEVVHDPAEISANLFLYHHSFLLFLEGRTQTMLFCRVIYSLWDYLRQWNEEMGTSAPDDLGKDDWFAELRHKRDSNWVMRLDEQYATASYWNARADDFEAKGNVATSLWYRCRALIDMCPWYPTEYYMATWEGQRLPEVQFIIRCLDQISQSLLALGALDHAYSVAMALLSNPFTTLDSKLSACQTITRAYHPATEVKHWVSPQFLVCRALYAEGPQHLWPTNQHIRRILADHHGMAPLYVRYRHPDFSPVSIVFWRSSDCQSGALFGQVSDHLAEEGEVMLNECTQAWFSCYGMRNCSNVFAYGVEDYVDEDGRSPGRTKILPFVSRHTVHD